MSSAANLVPGVATETTQPVRKPLWVDPPDQWENLDLFAYAVLPAIGASVTILKFQVPLGRNGVIKKVANNFVGAGWTEGTGAIIWEILVDGAPPPGATNYDAILGSLGSPANPVEIAGFRVYENQVITFVLNNISVAPGLQPVGARLIGWLYPKEQEGDATWL